MIKKEKWKFMITLQDNKKVFFFNLYNRTSVLSYQPDRWHRVRDYRITYCIYCVNKFDLENLLSDSKRQIKNQ